MNLTNPEARELEGVIVGAQKTRAKCNLAARADIANCKTAPLIRQSAVIYNLSLHKVLGRIVIDVVIVGTRSAPDLFACRFCLP